LVSLEIKLSRCKSFYKKLDVGIVALYV